MYIVSVVSHETGQRGVPATRVRAHCVGRRGVAAAPSYAPATASEAPRAGIHSLASAAFRAVMCARGPGIGAIDVFASLRGTLLLLSRPTRCGRALDERF